MVVDIHLHVIPAIIKIESLNIGARARFEGSGNPDMRKHELKRIHEQILQGSGQVGGGKPQG